MKIVQTAGRAALGEFAPEFAHFNDDVLFGENWNNQDIDVKTRSIITVVALMSSGITDSSLKYHLQNAKAHGVTQKEIAAIITHVAFYAGRNIDTVPWFHFYSFFSFFLVISSSCNTTLFRSLIQSPGFISTASFPSSW